ncbi:MAG: hypothetical protein ACTSRB_15115 [Candidatus Helarchaeota archaeon]
MLGEFKRRYKAGISYLMGARLKDVAEKFELPIFKIKRVAKDLLFGTKMEEILEDQIKDEGKLGLELAASELRIFKMKNGRIPKASEMRRIIGRIVIGYWEKYGINSWNELLLHVFKKINREANKYVGVNGLRRAIEEIKDIYKENEREPRKNDMALRSIAVLLSRGQFARIKVKSWKDLLILAFGEDQVIQWKNKKKKRKINKIKPDNESLFNEAISDMRAFYSEHQKMPRTTDLMHIARSIYHGRWKQKDIHSWNDMLVHVFGQIDKRSYKYHGEEGLKAAILEIQEFFNINHQLPQTLDLPHIARRIYKGYWIEQEIYSWKDILKKYTDA